VHPRMSARSRDIEGDLQRLAASRIRGRSPVRIPPQNRSERRRVHRLVRAVRCTRLQDETMMMRSIALLAALLATSNARALTLAKDGKSDYVIVLAAKPLPANARAAHELQSYFKQMTGAELAIVDDSKHPPAHSIIVGPNKYLEADKVLGND